jgi:hypothetical protein
MTLLKTGRLLSNTKSLLARRTGKMIIPESPFSVGHSIRSRAGIAWLQGKERSRLVFIANPGVRRPLSTAQVVGQGAMTQPRHI